MRLPTSDVWNHHVAASRESMEDDLKTLLASAQFAGESAIAAIATARLVRADAVAMRLASEHQRERRAEVRRVQAQLAQVLDERESSY